MLHRLLFAALLMVTPHVRAMEVDLNHNPVNDLSCRLYGNLAAKNPRKNLFFSPVSIANALAMTAEGARGQTALEMGVALGLDVATRRSDAQRPWDFDALHTSLGHLSTRLAGKPVPAELRTKIATLRAELDAANAACENSKGWEEARAHHDKAEAIADELNPLLAQVDQYEFRSANALWAQSGFHIEKPYLDAIARFYPSGGLFEVDFARDPVASANRINAWVSEGTRERIKEFISPDKISPATRLVLTNAVYFKGEWSEPFEAEDTADADFTSDDGSTSTVQLMHKQYDESASYAAFNADGSVFDTPAQIAATERQKTDAFYPAADGFTLLQLPYKGDDLSMLILLPRSATGLAALEAKLNAANLALWASKLEQRTTEVFLPKFKLETDYELAGPLQSMGMKRAFVDPGQPDGAEFDGISASSDPRQRLYISAVIHKAFVDVNEKGTEAAAATAVMMAAGSAAPRMVPFVPVFRADRPFVFAIRENKTGTILFLGRVVAQNT